MQDSAAPRREQRADVVSKKDRVREAYRERNPPKPPRLRNGLLAPGQQREVVAGEMDHPAVVESYTLSEAAQALGRSELTLKKWINDDLVPEPVLRETIHGYRVYSVGELTIMARVLAEHERDYSYYTQQHDVTRNTMQQLLHGYRMLHV